MAELLVTLPLLTLARAVMRPRRDAEPFCAWCVWRDGETCTHPPSPLGGQSCGPACIGEAQ
jgi:hypothetical protein